MGSLVDQMGSMESYQKMEIPFRPRCEQNGFPRPYSMTKIGSSIYARYFRSSAVWKRGDSEWLPAPEAMDCGSLLPLSVMQPCCYRTALASLRRDHLLSSAVDSRLSHGKLQQAVAVQGLRQQPVSHGGQNSNEAPCNFGIRDKAYSPASFAISRYDFLGRLSAARNGGGQMVVPIGDDAGRGGHDADAGLSAVQNFDGFARTNLCLHLRPVSLHVTDTHRFHNRSFSRKKSEANLCFTKCTTWR